MKGGDILVDEIQGADERKLSEQDREIYDEDDGSGSSNEENWEDSDYGKSDDDVMENFDVKISKEIQNLPTKEKDKQLVLHKEDMIDMKGKKRGGCKGQRRSWLFNKDFEKEGLDVDEGGTR